MSLYTLLLVSFILIALCFIGLIVLLIVDECQENKFYEEDSNVD